MALDWAPGLGLQPSFAIDGLSVAMLVLVAIASVPILGWTITLRDRSTSRLLALLGGFVLAVVGLFTAADALTLFVAWELTSILSYLLVGFDGADPAARRSARTTLLVTGAGGLALLVGLLLLGAGDLAELATLDPTSPTVAVGAWLVLLAAMTKSAQLPFHGWLTGAGTAPTAASALLHAATLVVAGVYVAARVAPLAAGVPGWTAGAVTVGLATFVWGHVVALRAVRSKQLLAATTAAQLGLALAAVATGTSAGIAVGVGLLLVHGAYKASLFLVAGTVTKATGSPRVAELWPATAGRPGLRTTLLLGAVTLAGAPPLAGWATKEGAVKVLLEQHPAAATAVAAGAVLGVLVAGRLLGHGRGRGRETGPTTTRIADRYARAAAWPAVLLVPAVILGPWTTPLDRLADTAATAVAGGEGFTLVAWPGFVLPLAISVGALALGAAALPLLPRVSTPPRRWAPDVLAGTVDRGLAAAGQLARRVEELPRPAVVGTVAGGAFITLLAVVDPTDAVATDLPLATTPLQLLAGLVLVAATLGVVVVRRRLAAALLLGIVGFAMAGVFAVHGAPDLVLTQVVVETVVVVVFVGVLRRLPPELPRPARTTLDGTGARALVAGVAAVIAAEVALRSAAVSGPRELAATASAAAEPVGAGKNVVNVILTDFRALDTVGELVVLFLAAAAILPLVARTAVPGRIAPQVSPLLARAAPTLTRIAVVLGVHLLVVGHDAPGGGFVAGLVIGAGLALHRLAVGGLPGRRLLQHPAPMLASGLLLVVGTVLAPLLWSLPLGDMRSVTLDLGLAAPKLTSALAFDVGVLLLVVGLVLTTLRTLDGEDTPAAPAVPEDALAGVGAGPDLGEHP